MRLNRLFVFKLQMCFYFLRVCLVANQLDYVCAGVRTQSSTTWWQKHLFGFSWTSAVIARVCTDMFSYTDAINPSPSSQTTCLQCSRHDFFDMMVRTDLIYNRPVPLLIGQMMCMFSHIIVLPHSSFTRIYAENPLPTSWSLPFLKTHPFPASFFTAKL